MNKYTPGPWQVVTPLSDPETIYIVATGGRFVACIVSDVPEGQGISLKESFENARLIATAPDLLASAKYVLESINAVDAEEVKRAICELWVAVGNAEGGNEIHKVTYDLPNL